MRARLILLCHGRTVGQDAVRFPADDPLSEKGLAASKRIASRLPRFDRALTSPAQAARQTAAVIGCSAEIEPLFRDQGFGSWAGRTLDDVRLGEPEAFAGWIAGSVAPPHGGESVSDVVARIAPWLDANRDGPVRTLAVTHPAVLRAVALHLLGAPASAVRRIDVEPLTLAEFTSDGRRWALRRLTPPFGGED